MKNKKILTVYYSHLGHTALIAKQIQSIAGGDIAEIKPEKPYSSSYFGTLLPAGIDIIKNKKPQINKIDISGYDIIFIGGPVWWMTVPPPLMSFLSANDFSGKSLLPFCTSGGNQGNFLKNFFKNSNGGKVIEGIGFSGKELKKPMEISNKLKSWIEEKSDRV